MTGKLAKKRLLGVYCRGILMGAADVVPGVSGGTVAFITGIYEELLDAIKSINVKAIKLLFAEGVTAAWSHINGNFLLVLMLGIVTSILLLARVISYLLEAYPLLVWSFFFGLIVASCVHMVKQIKQWQPLTLIALLVGVVMAVAVTELKAVELVPGPAVFFGAGCIAICAMILPGISGSFILVLLGMYGHVLAAAKDLQVTLLLAFVAGCGVGILSFSRVLSWLFTRFHDATLALLTGFLIGSLNLVWPWKLVLSFYTNSHGKRFALEQENVFPWVYQAQTGIDPSTVFCVGLMVLGLILVFLLEKSGEKATEAGEKSSF
ncbi:MAG: DUF368 domain-containing protein [Spongiibacteraceae bacterium]